MPPVGLGDEVVFRQYDGRTSGERHHRFDQGPLRINTSSVNSVPTISTPTGGSPSLANSPTRRIVLPLPSHPQVLAWRSQPAFCSGSAMRQTRKDQAVRVGDSPIKPIGIPSWGPTITSNNRPGIRLSSPKNAERICTSQSLRNWCFGLRIGRWCRRYFRCMLPGAVTMPNKKPVLQRHLRSLANALVGLFVV